MFYRELVVESALRPFSAHMFNVIFKPSTLVLKTAVGKVLGLVRFDVRVLGL